MAFLGKLLKKGIKLRETLEQDYTSPLDLQKNELRKLLITAKDTYFGQYHYFKTILNGFKDQDEHLFYQYYKSNVPIYSYETINDEWWSKGRQGIKGVTWPGKVKYYALSSGTSSASSKYIPVTTDMIKSIRKTSVRQLLSISKYDLEPEFFEKGILMVGGSTDLKFNGRYFEGDLSGITTSQVPFWFQHFYKPGKKISAAPDWNQKLNEMVEKAASWDIGVVVGVPAWIQILIEKIIAHYQLDNIHDIWPNLKIFVHGGVSFKPYKKGFEKLLGKPLMYLETYLASEGFVAFQDDLAHESMKLVMNNGIFYEFVPFTSENFDEDGQVKADASTYKIDEVELDKEYALLMSTNAGAWRYLIGDVVKFTNLAETELIITGRTKHFLSLCGEHLSMDNMNRAMEMTAQQLNIDVKEFTVAGESHGGLFAHHWYVGTDQSIDESQLKSVLDHHLKELNDDYKVERSAALKDIFVTVVSPQQFYQWMKQNGKEGGQSKFPRVLKSERLESWQTLLENDVI
ncbi:MULTISPECIES: GH3 auxin-responsive promoter family protein [Reichenbachiella]|uniref:GH3 auxin-responsive promoter n=1 Tax=Reichenbachiella agariperforans TaxID=156994 RepID=A0A1M6JCR0_REIAG|nr:MULTISPECIES: GH3 auxin-responsive promoter family protein [Reichenbachiella]RJE74853.1 GH3 auxin-responsive promoter [Reichenbachiella sp. MSK19-1]SHJ44499.1 GH3 auxin-responsive promoter [Reichenbachiella agariperforans]